MHTYLTWRAPWGLISTRLYSWGYIKPFFGEVSAAIQAGDIGSLFHCAWLTVIHQAFVFAELRCIRLTSGDCHVRCKLWPLSLNSACHVRIMTKPAGKRLQLSANKDILVCVNIYCTSMHTGEYSEPEPESKLQISAPRKQSIVNKPTDLFIDLRNVVTVTTLYVHQAQL